MGGPSESSSGLTRNFRTAKTLTAATIEKMKMQIPVTNQKTKSIRPASREADCGSQSGIRATAEAIPPASTPITISWTIEPLRTAPRAYFTSASAAWAAVSGVPRPGTGPLHPRRLNGTRSWNLPDRGWRNPHIRRQQHLRGGRHRHRRLDLDDRWAAQRRAVDALLAVLGGAGLLERPPADDLRRRRPATRVVSRAKAELLPGSGNAASRETCAAAFPTPGISSA